ncbi:MAG: hypothetical protein KAT15_00530 [Bacteroidales bacterium]|nr:hypothetical protein [Bacteroidales bacterium]
MKHFIITALLLISIQASGQDFMRSAGIRGGVSSGISYRGFLNPELAYEGLLSFRNNGLQFTILRQHFEPALSQISDGFFVTYGYGGHLGYTNSHTYNRFYKTVHHPQKKFSPLLGLDGYLGIEYHFPGIPVQVGLDYKPFFELSLNQYFQMSAWDFAFTLKYKF